MYPFYEKAAKAGIVNMFVHKNLMPRDYRHSWAGVWKYQTPRDLVKAAADWPQLNFIIYNGGFRALFDHPKASLNDFETTGRIDWCSDLAEIQAQNGAPTCMPKPDSPSSPLPCSTRALRRRFWAAGSRAWAPLTSCGVQRQLCRARRSGR